MALPTRGRILVETTVGDIEIELWSKETPKTCRNIIALSMEGYYDGVIFHRVVPGFLVQTGDRTGTGGGGESFYGEPFEDEIHPRLRFPHRGLVAMANNGTKDSNDSQFFITLDRAEELHGTHTLFGRCVGDSIFNVLKIGSCELGENERPIYPPKIKTIRILDNPFDDIVPRITADEKRAQQRAKEEAQKEREKEASKKKTKSNPKLLSFGGDDETETTLPVKKKSMARPDLIEQEDNMPWLNATSAPTEPINAERQVRASEALVQDAQKREAKAKPTKLEKKPPTDKTVKSEVQKLEDEVRKLTRGRDGDSDSDEGHQKKKSKGPSLLLQELSKYTVGRGAERKRAKRKDESDVMAALDSFRGKLQKSQPDSAADGDTTEESGKALQQPTGEDGGMEVDDDVGWLNHELQFAKDNDEEVAKAERDYEVIDPRARAHRAREEERQKKSTKQSRSHRR